MSQGDLSSKDEPAPGPSRPPPSSTEEEDDTLPGTSDKALWSKLPAPKTAAKKVIQFQLPIHKAMLSAAKDDDDDDKPKKKMKSNAGKSKLMDFLPAPKNDLPPPGKALGAGPSTKKPAAAQGTAQASVPSGFFDSDQGSTPATNDMYRVDQPEVQHGEGAMQGQEYYYGAEGQDYYAAYYNSAGQYDASAYYGYDPGQQQQAAPENALEQALKQEQQKKRGRVSSCM